jgi:HD-like signal output (HDOD) protein
MIPMTDARGLPTAERESRPHTVDKPCIVFVDDEEPILAALIRLIRRDGYDINVFTDPVSALTFLESHPANVIAADMRMPTMSGLAFLNKAADRSPESSRIIISAYEDNDIVLQALDKGLAQHYTFKPWEDDQLRELIRESIRLQSEIKRNHLSKIIDRLRTLPASSISHQRVQDLLSQRDVPMRLVVQEIEKSPALVARLLRVANSVHFATRNPVTTIKEAVRFIGTDYIATIVSAMAAFSGISEGAGKEAMRLIEEIWGISFRRANRAKLIARDRPGFTEGQLAYTTALIQDMGYVVQITFELEAYKRFLRTRNSENLTPYEAEKRIFSATHDEVGSILLTYWNFPPRIVDAVARHHAVADGDELVQIIQIADALENSGLCVPHDPAIDAIVEQYRTETEHVPQEQS